MRRITIGLSEEGFNKAAEWLDDYAKRTLPKNVVKLISHMTRTGEVWAMTLMNHIDTGETLASIQGFRNGDKGVIVAGGAAVWIEFGTGVVANAGNQPHPKASELGMSPWGTFGKGHGASPSGWWYVGDDGEVHHTYGIEGNRFMYNTAQMLMREYPKMAKEIFGGDD